jgi:outer membrane protein assembly factor BamB
MRRLVLLAFLLLSALSAFGQMEGMQPVIAPDGTILVVRPTLSSDNTMTSALVAVSPAGAKLWTWDAPAAMVSITASGTRVYVVTRNGQMTRGGMGSGMGPGMGRTPGDPFVNTTTLVALDTATGRVLWSLTL